MIVKYYKNSELAYTNRNRYSFSRFNSFTPFAIEEQRALLLGNSAQTQLKTSSENICNYVTIDETRWYVTSYNYLNGGQVSLNLQRDVIGENGFNSFFGKVERGYTETFLRNKPELSLNQRLVNRIPIKTPITDEDNGITFGQCRIPEYSSDGIDQKQLNPLWGILYIVKPSSVTGDEVTVSIPAFSISTVDYVFLPNGSKSYPFSINENIEMIFRCDANLSDISGIRLHYFFDVDCYYIYTEKGYKLNVSVSELPQKMDIGSNYIELFIDRTDVKSTTVSKIVEEYFKNLMSFILSTVNSGFSLPEFPSDGDTKLDYDNVAIKKTESSGDVFYRYSSTILSYKNVGETNSSSIKNTIGSYIREGAKTINIDGVDYHVGASPARYHSDNTNTYSSITYKAKKYTYKQVENKPEGSLTIPLNSQLIDEPYTIIVCPLYDVEIQIKDKQTSNYTSYKVKRELAFNAFNNVIETLSGDSGYLVDAQIYPYAPPINNVISNINDTPFCSIISNNYTLPVSVIPNALTDIKKDYIERSYSIISPEQSGKFTFNFYDYTNDNSKNSKLNLNIKTALKPFSIVSALVITPEKDCLFGDTYESDLRGCSPSGNGFECSLSSNAFETYRRQNSNYQQIFALQQGELKKSHQVERKNEIVQGVANTLTQTVMGAIGGAAVGGKIGAAIGGTAAGATTGVLNALQFKENEELRLYEEKIQQQQFDLQIGTIKNLPNTINRISSFNELVLKNFYYVLEIYECSQKEKIIVNSFIDKFSYSLGIIDFFSNYYKNGWFIKGSLMQSNLITSQHQIAAKELAGGIYYNE